MRAIFHGWGQGAAGKGKPQGLGRRLFNSALGFALLTGCLLIVLEREENYAVRYDLVAIRESLLTGFTTNTQLLDASPQTLTRDGFRYDRPDQIARFRAQLLRSPHYAQALAAIAAEPDEIKKAQLIVRSFSVGGNVAPIYRLPLLQKLQCTLKGDGCCSDHSEIFLALASACGLWAREIQNDVHSFADFYSIAQHKWIYVDPLLAIMATDERGTYLSSPEIRTRRLLNRSVHYVFFGTGFRHAKSTTEPMFQHCYGSPDRFRRIGLAYGSDRLSEDGFGKALLWAPWELQKALAILSGVHPHIVCLADGYNRMEVHAVQMLRWTVLIGGACFAACLLLYPLQQLYRLAAHLRRPATFRRPMSYLRCDLLRQTNRTR